MRGSHTLAIQEMIMYVCILILKTVSDSIKCIIPKES